MRIRGRALLLFLLPALCLPGLPTAVAAAPSPTPPITPGRYAGMVNMTIMHAGSTGGGGISTNWHVDMVGSTGIIQVRTLRFGSWAIVVDMPVPVDHLSDASISDEASKCKGYRVTSVGLGLAEGSGYGGQRAGQAGLGEFVIDRMDFTLHSVSPSVAAKGECPSQKWEEVARTAIETDFTAIFGSEWTFTVTTATPSLAGTCESASFGKAKGQMLTCDWRAYPIPER